MSSRVGPRPAARSRNAVITDGDTASVVPNIPPTDAGQPFPLGVRYEQDGINFAVFSRHATQMELLLFDAERSASPLIRIVLDSDVHRTGDIWHVRVQGDFRQYNYLLRAEGPLSQDLRRQFDPRKLLLDPYATLIAPCAQEFSVHDCLRSDFVGIITEQVFDWQGVSPPRHSWSDTIIYETHVRGFTIDPSSNAHFAGQYLGVIEKIAYLKDLGVTAVELLPVTAFNPRRAVGPESAVQAADYWGYNPIALFSPHPGYASPGRSDSAAVGFKTMVRELHRAGIEVILDVVFNHTGEGGIHGPCLSFRGLDNAIYYLLSADGSRYLDYTGCGNTLNCNHPVVRTMIIDCLRHWVLHIHIDGFRFDLAAVLGRGTDGVMLANPPLLDEIAQDRILRDVKLIAEAWDAGGAFEVGRFAGARWGEWNSDFRDDVRRFWRGDAGFTGAFASRLCGSADLYEHDGQTVIKSINFITSHDGFTLQDWVSYSRKHNEPNGEGNRDGLEENFSANCGIEGPSSSADICDLRQRQVKNCLASLLLSRGVPMLLGGDEFGRTQAGNNNAYCQDNSVSWYDWNLLQTHAGLLRFVRRLLDIRKEYAVLRAEKFYSSDEIDWIGPEGQPPDWGGPLNRIGCIIKSATATLALLFNATAQPCRFSLLSRPGVMWQVLIDSAAEPPNDAPEAASAPMIDGISPVQVTAHSSLVVRAVH